VAAGFGERLVGGSAIIALVLFCVQIPQLRAQDRSSPPAAVDNQSQAVPVLRAGTFDIPVAGATEPVAAQDGDFTPVPDATAQQPDDGVFVQADPQLVEDGLDPTRVDQRDSADRGQFDFEANPDPLPDGNELLQQIDRIDPLDPASNRRVAQFAALEPYDPLGIRIGTFVLFPEAELALVRFSNVFSSPDGQSDYAGELRPSLRLVSDWSNHALEVSATGDLSNYTRFSSENDRGFSLEARGRADITRRTNVQGAIRRDRSQEDRSAIDAAQAGERASVTTDAITGSFNHRFNRLSLQLRGGISDTEYADPSTGSLNDRDVVEKTSAVRASWEFKPTLQVFVDVEGNDRSYQAASSADGRLRNSQGLRLRTGVSFGDSSQILRGEVSLGHARQDLEDRRLEDANGFIADANLAWRINGLTSLLLTASSDISAVTQTANSGAVLERRAGVEARHAFRRHLIGSIGVEGTRRDYAGIDVDETEFALSLGLEYFLSREAVAFTRYEHTVFRSDFAGSDYESDEIRVGLRLRR
jgi:hypothetical protein